MKNYEENQKISTIDEIKKYQNLIQKQNQDYKEKFLRDQLQINKINQTFQSQNSVATEPIQNKSKNNYNYSAIFDPEIINILSGVNTKTNKEITKKEEINLNESIYSFVDCVSKPPSREFHCSRHFLSLEGNQLEENIKRSKIKLTNKRKGNKNRGVSLNIYDRRTKKLQKAIRKLSLHDKEINSSENISKEDFKKTMENSRIELNEKITRNKKIVLKKKVRNYDNGLRELTEEEILKIINSIEGIIDNKDKILKKA